MVSEPQYFSRRICQPVRNHTTRFESLAFQQRQYLPRRRKGDNAKIDVHNYTPSAYFEKTGCLLSLDGSEDRKIKIEGMPEYQPPVAPKIDDDEMGFEDPKTIFCQEKETCPSLPEIQDEETSDHEPEVESDVTDEEQIDVEEL